MDKYADMALLLEAVIENITTTTTTTTTDHNDSLQLPPQPPHELLANMNKPSGETVIPKGLVQTWMWPISVISTAEMFLSARPRFIQLLRLDSIFQFDEILEFQQNLKREREKENESEKEKENESEDEGEEWWEGAGMVELIEKGVRTTQDLNIEWTNSKISAKGTLTYITLRNRCRLDLRLTKLVFHSKATTTTPTTPSTPTTMPTYFPDAPTHFFEADIDSTSSFLLTGKLFADSESRVLVAEELELFSLTLPTVSLFPNWIWTRDGDSSSDDEYDDDEEEEESKEEQPTGPPPISPLANTEIMFNLSCPLVCTREKSDEFY